MTTSPFQIAIAQSFVDTDVKTNCKCICELMQQAHDAGARLIHFPEGALSGYPKSQIGHWSHVNWYELEDQITKIAAKARDLGLFVIFGTNYDFPDDHAPRNSLIVISDRGEILGRYDKRFCSHTEITDWYSAGTQPLVFEVDGLRFGCILCIEVNFPELFAEYENSDVDCILFSAYAGDAMFWIQAQGHAACTSMWISLATPSQCASTLSSGLIGPNGNMIARACSSPDPELLLATIEIEAPQFDTALRKARPWRRKARSGEIYR